MSDKNFKPGDLVMLKSGSPAMTVNEIIPDSNRDREDDMCCVWFCGEEFKKCNFKPSALKISD